MAWVFISDNEVAAGAPIVNRLMRKLRDNPLAILQGSPTVPPEARIKMGPGQVTATVDKTKALAATGPGAATQWLVPPKLRVQVFTAPGAFVVPAGVTEVAFEMWGGGGLGQSSGFSGLYWRGPIGGGGGYAFVSFLSTPGESFTVTPAGVSGTGDGNASTVSASGGRLVTAYGGYANMEGAPRSTAANYIQAILLPGGRLGCAGGLGHCASRADAPPGVGGFNYAPAPGFNDQRGLGRVHVFWME